MDAAAAHASVSWAVLLLHGLVLGAGMLTSDAAEIVAAEVAGLCTAGRACVESVCPSGRLSFRRLTARLAPVVRFLRGIGISILIALRCPSARAMPAWMPEELTWLRERHGSNKPA